MGAQGVSDDCRLELPFLADERQAAGIVSLRMKEGLFSGEDSIGRRTEQPVVPDGSRMSRCHKGLKGDVRYASSIVGGSVAVKSKPIIWARISSTERLFPTRLSGHRVVGEFQDREEHVGVAVL